MTVLRAAPSCRRQAPADDCETVKASVALSPGAILVALRADLAAVGHHGSRERADDVADILDRGAHADRLPDLDDRGVDLQRARRGTWPGEAPRSDLGGCPAGAVRGPVELPAATASVTGCCSPRERRSVHDGLLVPGDRVRGRVRAGEEAAVLDRDRQRRRGIEDHVLVGRNDDLVVGHPPEHGGEGDGHHAQTGEDYGKQSDGRRGRRRMTRRGAAADGFTRLQHDENDEGDGHEREGDADTVAHVAALEEGGERPPPRQGDQQHDRQDPAPSASARRRARRAAAAPAAAGSAALPTVCGDPDLLGGRYGRHWRGRVGRENRCAHSRSPGYAHCR